MAAVLLLARRPLLASVGTAAAAKTLTVTRTDDPAPGPCLPEDCSLREALESLERHRRRSTIEVVVPAAAAHYEIDLGTLEITDQVEVQGAGADGSCSTPAAKASRSTPKAPRESSSKA